MNKRQGAQTRSTFSRIFAPTAVMLVLSFLVIGGAFWLIAYRTNFLGQRETLRTSACEVADVAAQGVQGTSLQAGKPLRSYLALINRITGYHFVITDTQGTVILTSDAAAVPDGLRVGEEEMSQALLGGEYAGVGGLGGLYAGRFVSVGVPVFDSGGKTVGAVFVSAEIAGIRSAVSQFLKILIGVSLLVIAGSFLWSFYYTRRFTRPLGRMAEASREFAQGNFGARVDENLQEAEVRALAVSFNNMADSLERAEEGRREFIANISHELKTPMTSISGYVDGILDGVIPAEKQADYLRIVSSETKRLSRLVTEMLEISRVEAEEGGEERMQIFDLCELARQVLLSQEKKITDRKLDVDVRFDEPVQVVANTDGITRVIYNLLDNAVKYSDEGTTITLDIAEEGGKAVFSVSDVGKPISPEERDRIFERFHKADRSRKTEGLGLGLYLVKQIMARHKEDVWCETDGARTTMRFTLPLSGTSEKPAKRERGKEEA